MSCGLIHSDCFDVFPHIPTASIDLILCDLPYGTTQNKWDSVIKLDALWAQYWRIAKQDAAVVLTAAQPFTSALVMSCPAKFRYEWIWIKSKITGVLNAKRMPVRKHEQVLVFYQNQPTYNAQGLITKGTSTKQGGNSNNYGKRNTEDYIQEFTNWPRDVLEIASEGNTVHPTQKPVALMEYLIRTYTNEGDVVLDNCMGSGTTGVACNNTNRRFIGIEKDLNYFEMAKQRINYPPPSST